ncbi:MAG: polysaccharide biosynthesis/export family protein, partial [Flaviramulus sp.]|nr:polysaccharide biosynthesis/export family protein [Flaviramulus sp.]
IKYQSKMQYKFKSKIINRFMFFAILLTSCLLFNCVSANKINYFQIEDNSKLTETIVNYEPKLQINDILTINVSAIDKESAIPFNLVESQNIGNQIPLPYIVNVDGEINFPVLGKIKVTQLTTKELTDSLTQRLLPYLKKPIVNIRITNFKITVLGEVKNPGSYGVLNERISIIEALGLAGDLTIYGDRKNIVLIREYNGKRTSEIIDLTNKALFDSPYFYLSQNDALYVASNKTKVNSSGVGPNTSVILSSISILTTIIAILVR